MQVLRFATLGSVNWPALGVLSLSLSLSTLATAGSAAASRPSTIATGSSNDSYLETLSKNQRSVFTYAMDVLDTAYQKTPPFVFNSVRYGVWHGVGLLARNEGNDSAMANDIFTQALKYQYTNPADKWYGTFKDSPNQPDPGPDNPPVIYQTYDPNMGLFVATSWIIALEEFGDLLDPQLQQKIKESVYVATVGDGYRVGGVDRDNLRPAYSNPWYMRVMATTYCGEMFGDKNMTHWGDVWANETLDLFNRYHTMSEFNSATYAGVSLYALSLWGYMPKSSVIHKNAPMMIEHAWRSIGELYNPSLHTLGGPWDRSYGFDMRKYFGILGAQIAGLVGGIDDGTAPVPNPVSEGGHVGDAAAFVLTPLISKFHDKHVPASVQDKLRKVSKPHTFSASAVSPPYDQDGFGPRNYTAWVQEGVSVGGIEIDEAQRGGPAVNPSQFTPGAILWDTGVEGAQVGWISHYPTSGSISCVAGEESLRVSYPPSKAWPDTSVKSSIFTFFFSPLADAAFNFTESTIMTDGSATLPGLKVQFGGEAIDSSKAFVAFSGSKTINDLKYWNVTFEVKSGYEGIPEIILSFDQFVH